MPALEAGVLDESQIHQISVLFGDGRRQDAQRYRSEVGSDSKCPAELGHVVTVVVGRLVALMEIDLLLGRQARDSGSPDRARDEARSGIYERTLGIG